MYDCMPQSRTAWKIVRCLWHWLTSVFQRLNFHIRWWWSQLWASVLGTMCVASLMVEVRAVGALHQQSAVETAWILHAFALGFWAPAPRAWHYMQVEVKH